MKCKNCGKEGDGNFCAYCGASMRDGWRYKDLNETEFWQYNNHPVIRGHYNFIGKEMELYNAVTESKDYFGAAADRFIALANEDIKLARLFYDLTKKYRQPLPGYYSFKQLAILYEHREEYRKAIGVCEAAIYCHFDDDGTKGGMQARLEKLRKKADGIA